MDLDLIVRVLLMGGTFINVMCIPYVLGIAYVTPLATSSPGKYLFILLLTPVVIIASTAFGWIFFRQDRYPLALAAMFGWMVVYWALFADLFITT